MITKAAIVFAVLILLFVALVASRPAEFRIERSINMSAPSEKVFPFINDLRQFNLWNPWSKQDPNIRLSYDGPANGIGARSVWSGNSQVGEGSMTITHSEPGNIVRLRLDFKKPFEATNTAEFILAPRGQETSLTWVMTGRQHFIPRAIGLFIDVETMMGRQFDDGLVQLKSLAESGTK